MTFIGNDNLTPTYMQVVLHLPTMATRSEWKRIVCVLWWITCGLTFYAQSNHTIEQVYLDFSNTWKKAITSEKITGVSWAVFDADTILFAEGVGYANKENNIAATPQTVYRIGSITKLFTATLALQAIEQDKWTLSTPWPQLLPNTPIQSLYGNNESITLWHLLSHQSGLPSDILKNAFTTYPIQPALLLDQLPKIYTIAPPGFITVYSNIAYTAIGLALSTTYNASYEELIQVQIAKPLDLHHTTTIQKDYTTKAYDDNSKAKPEPYIRDIPAGGLYSNVIDLSKFAQAWMNHTLLGKALRDEAWRQQNTGLPLDLEREQGLGWQIRTWGSAGKVLWHNGANQYHRSMLVVAPELNVGVVVLSNDIKAENILSLVFRFVDQLGQWKGLSPRRSNNQWSPDDLTAIDWTEDKGKVYEGQYVMPGYQFDISAKSYGLQLSLPDRKLRLLPVDSHLFYPVQRRWLIFTKAEKEVLFSFQTIAGVPIMLRHHWQGQTDLFGFKEPKLIPISTAWQRRTGRYELINRGKGEIVPFKDWKIYREGQRLYLSVDDIRSQNTYTFLLNTVDDRMAIMLPIGRSSGEVITVLQDNEGGQLLRVFGYILRRK